MSDLKFDSIEDAITDIANGKMVIVVDDEDRENEGDLLMAAQFVTADAINFMIKHAKGLVCVPLAASYLDRFNLIDMVPKNEDHLQTAFTISIDATPDHGVSTGISAADRAKTIQVLLNPNSNTKDIQSPGHIFPLRSRDMGVLKRAGHTEAAVDLAKLAGCMPAGIICEIIKEDGQMARTPDLFEFAKTHQLKFITIKSLIEYRASKERFIEVMSEELIQTPFGEFKAICYKDTLNDLLHYALVKGDISPDQTTLVRVHSESLYHDLFAAHLDRINDSYIYAAMKQIQDAGSGVLLYMKKYPSLDLKKSNGNDRFRDYGVGAQILSDLGVKKMNLLSNSQTKLVGLDGFGLEIIDRVHIDPLNLD